MTAAAHAPTAGPYVASLTSYTKAGWRGVLPIPAGAKWPPPDGRVHPNEKPVDLLQDLIGKCPPGVEYRAAMRDLCPPVVRGPSLDDLEDD